MNGTTLDVDGSGTFAGSVTATSLTTNTISSNGSNADLSLQPSGTGDVVVGGIRVNGTTLDSSDSTLININEGLVVDGTGNFSGTLTTADITNTNNITTTQLDADGVRIKDNLITTISSNANLEVAKSSLKAFGTDALKSLLQESGLGNHPEVIRFMYRAGKAISEDSYVGNSQGASAKGNGIPKDFNGIANALYSNQQNK